MSSSSGDSSAKVGYVGGGPGTYSEAAAVEYFTTSPDRPKGFVTKAVNNLEELLSQVKSGELDYGVVPIENSLSGTMYGVYDHLIESEGVHIVGECAVFEELCLVALPGTTFDAVKTVFSHPHVLQQCTGYLSRKLGKKLRQVNVADTVTGCNLLVEEKLTEAAAIASETAAKLNGLEV